MSTSRGGMSCQTGCWALAAGVALIIFLLLLVMGESGWLASIFLGGVAFVVLGFAFSWIFCKPLTRPADAAAALKTPGSAGVTPGSAGVKPGSAGTGATGAGSSGEAEAAPSAAAAETSGGSASTAGSPATTGAALPGSAPATADAEAGAKVKPTTQLKGQEELAGKKGEWKYEGDKKAAAASAPEPVMAAGSSNGADKDAATAASLDPDAPQEKPATLDGPRDGGADNLKEIKGVGPKLEIMLNEMGFYHFDQIANWTAAEVNWVNQNLTGFKGRVTRDEWVSQAKILASGGDTEFSKRVDKGGVY
ncbi:NADH dehydrogenase subunit E [Roseivivax sp. THAF40]|uniref:endonuclease n=1 Tax=unclassified Roseivivax TaxID=2639302 RepID=UPI0012691F69|nr:MULTISPECIES: endonuclease [unclassified Roseivivax]QFS82174.1 NADH dehydrogenase subunit E [Roseivivax sp. THAF197b]QFT45974.1 NADH dehydrogenase subunit E [Roseivivax sp. THAF40]